MAEKRAFTRIGHGIETQVFTHTKGGREGKTVVKDMDGNIDDAEKERLVRYHERIREIYGPDIIPRQKFIRDKNNPEKWLLVQEKVKLAEHPDVLDYKPGGDLLDSIRERLKVLLEELKKSWIEFERVGNSNGRPFLDLFGHNNLLITQDNTLTYIDSGQILGYLSFEKDGKDVIYGTTAARIALLELIVEGHLSLRDNELYTTFFDYCMGYYDEDSQFPDDFNSNDPQKLYLFLKDFVKITGASRDRIEK